MCPADVADWRSDLGVTDRAPPFFFEHKDQLTQTMRQAYFIRRAFELLNLDGVLCSEHAPLVYFKQVDRIIPDKIRDIHKKFWNHGGAPLLIVISSHEVQVYSSLIRPGRSSAVPALHADPEGLVLSIDRASAALRELVPMVETGEFFRQHERSFKLTDRVDRSLLDNLTATRDKLAPEGASEALDAFLCRLVFTCYLFDRNVIGESYLESLGLPGLSHLRDILSLRPRTRAKVALYRLFGKLAADFNGDLFRDELTTEAALVSEVHIETVDEFFRGRDMTTGQSSFWPYDFEAIPIETISAIYERFLKSADKRKGSFYTPRFLAELVLDVALGDQPSLLGLRFLDPACGSGIFLVGVFNRMAEEWRQANPKSRNGTRARELARLLQSHVLGIDSDPTACRIAAFSLYLAYLDQLSPRDIQDLQAKGRALPNLVMGNSKPDVAPPGDGAIWCGDFFDEARPHFSGVDLIIGNPPWGSIAGAGTAASGWLARHGRSVPDGQIAAAFMWKAPTHLSPGGRVCFVLPHGILFNHGDTALGFQNAFFQTYAVDRVINLTDFQSFLFSKARHPALVITYNGRQPGPENTTAYWAPKTDWRALKTEIITISEMDRSLLPQRAILEDLRGPDAPQIWKRMSWATPRDRRLLDRLSEFPRLRDQVRQARERKDDKHWLIAEGFQPLGENDDPERATALQLPSPLFVQASSPDLQLFLLEDECVRLPASQVRVRARSNKRVEVYGSPHVLVSHGFGSIAFADFPVAFQHALRGITGPASDRSLLIFLAAYLQSSVAQYYQFHTSSNWGVSRNKVHVEELLRLPFFLPSHSDDLRNSVIQQVARIVEEASREARASFLGRDEIRGQAKRRIEPLIFDYFDIIPSEQVLIADTIQTAIGSFRPGMRRANVPAIEPSDARTRKRYTETLCATLNGWSRRLDVEVSGATVASEGMGFGLVTLEKAPGGSQRSSLPSDQSMLRALSNFRSAASHGTNTFELARGVKLFDGDKLYLLKPLSARYWSETAALNDADEIAGSILLASEARPS
jgi:N-6 DNA methylase